MQLIGRLIQLLPLQKGQGKNGEWKKQDIIIESEGQYPKKVCFSIWGERINEQQLVIGNTLIIDFDAESREFGGRWYTELKAWKITSNTTSSSAEATAPQNNLANISPLSLEEDDSDVLPF